MNTFKSSLLSGACAVLVCVAFPSGASAQQEFGPFTVEGALKTQATTIANSDLGTSTDGSQDNQSIEARLRLTWALSDTITAMGEGRIVENFGVGGSIDPDTGEPLGIEDFVELRQYWVQSTSLFGQTPLSAKIGRQRFSEPVGLWWGRDLDAVRVSYNTTLLNNFIAIGQNLAAYRTNKADFQHDDEDLFRVMGETSLQWKYEHFIEARFAYLNDHSGSNTVGTLLPDDDLDSSDADLVWAGLRSRGELSGFDGAEKANYRLDIMGVTGEDNIESTIAGPAGFRSVSGHDKQDVQGWAVDSAINIPLPVAAKPEVILGYAFGSGDDNPADDTDHAFRQTGLDSNSSRPGLSTGAVQNFGSVLRPDLSNIHILTAGAGVPLSTATDVSMIYHYYRLAENTTSLSTSGISAPLNNADKDLGDGVDLIFNTNLSQELGLNTGKVGPLTLKTTLGAFRAGDAYGTAADEVSSRGYIELQLKF